jgi:hypothetical protein
MVFLGFLAEGSMSKEGWQDQIQSGEETREVISRDKFRHVIGPKSIASHWPRISKVTFVKELLRFQIELSKYLGRHEIEDTI